MRDKRQDRRTLLGCDCAICVLFDAVEVELPLKRKKAINFDHQAKLPPAEAIANPSPSIKYPPHRSHRLHPPIPRISGTCSLPGYAYPHGHPVSGPVKEVELGSFIHFYLNSLMPEYLLPCLIRGSI
jgi:hypothetical protein